MLNNPDFKDLLSLFRDCEVRFLVMGDYAVLEALTGASPLSIL